MNTHVSSLIYVSYMWAILACVWASSKTSSLTTRMRCPRQCQCAYGEETGKYGLSVKCRRLTEVPDFKDLISEPIYRIYLHYGGIEMVPAKAFEGLTLLGIDLGGNPITSIDPDAFAGITGLRYLSLSMVRPLRQAPSTYLSHISSSLQVLDLSVNLAQRTYGNDSFGDLPVLQNLLLGKNANLKQISSNAFDGMPNLRLLDLTGCHALGEVPAAVKRLHHLDSLYIYGSRIKELPSRVFSTLTKLKILIAHTNSISSTDLAAQTQLEELDLSINQLDAIPDLDNMSKLKRLDISINKIKKVSSKAFKSQKKLEELDISDNPLDVDKLQHGGLSNLKQSLKILKLNSLIGLNASNFPSLMNALTKLVQLEKLDLSYNKLYYLPEGIFSGLTARTIDLSGCELTEIQKHTFLNLKAPLTIVLTNNKLKSLNFLTEDPCLFKHVYLRFNHLHCDCALTGLADYSHLEVIGECKTPKVIDLKKYISSTLESCHHSNHTEHELAMEHRCSQYCHHSNHTEHQLAMELRCSQYWHNGSKTVHPVVWIILCLQIAIRFVVRG